MTRQEKVDEITDKAELNVEERILDLLLPPPKSSSSGPLFDFDSGETTAPVLVPDTEPKGRELCPHPGKAARTAPFRQAG
jgi:ATP-dependent HslUV protease ATP-binding subunit HslU